MSGTHALCKKSTHTPPIWRLPRQRGNQRTCLGLLATPLPHYVRIRWAMNAPTLPHSSDSYMRSGADTHCTQKIGAARPSGAACLSHGFVLNQAVGSLGYRRHPHATVRSPRLEPQPSVRSMVGRRSRVEAVRGTWRLPSGHRTVFRAIEGDRGHLACL